MKSFALRALEAAVLLCTVAATLATSGGQSNLESERVDVVVLARAAVTLRAQTVWAAALSYEIRPAEVVAIEGPTPPTAEGLAAIGEQPLAPGDAVEGVGIVLEAAGDGRYDVRLVGAYDRDARNENTGGWASYLTLWNDSDAAVQVGVTAVAEAADEYDNSAPLLEPWEAP